MEKQDSTKNFGQAPKRPFWDSRYDTVEGCCPAGIAILAFVAGKCVCAREATVQLATFIYTFRRLSSRKAFLRIQERTALPCNQTRFCIAYLSQKLRRNFAVSKTCISQKYFNIFPRTRDYVCEWKVKLWKKVKCLVNRLTKMTRGRP